MKSADNLFDKYRYPLCVGSSPAYVCVGFESGYVAERGPALPAPSLSDSVVPKSDSVVPKSDSN